MNKVSKLKFSENRVFDLKDENAHNRIDSLTSQLNDQLLETESINNSLTDLKEKVNDYFVSVKEYGAKGDGVSDDTSAIQNALDSNQKVFIPAGVYCISDTLVLRPYSVLIGDTRTRGLDGNTHSSKLKWVGGNQKQKSVLQISQNGIGENNSAYTATEVFVRNIHIDGNNLVGFGVYCTYLTGEGHLDNITVSNTNEHAFFIVKSWFAKYTNLTARDNNGSGISFNMPLRFLDGSELVIGGSTEINACYINNIRAHTCGKYFINNTYNDENNLRHGYGIGVGYGNNLIVNQFQVEKNYGVGVYFIGNGNLKKLNNGYLEDNHRATTLVDKIYLLIEDNNVYEGSDSFENIYFQYNMGTIKIISNVKRYKRFTNIFFPKNIVSDTLTDFELKELIIKTAVTTGGNQYNAYPSDLHLVNRERINVQESWRLDATFLPRMVIVYAKLVSGEPTSTVVARDIDGNVIGSMNWSELTNEWKVIRVFAGNVAYIEKSGVESSGTAMVDIMLFESASTLR